MVNCITGAIAKTSFYTESILPHNIFSLNCSGEEVTLFDCMYSEVLSVGSNCYSNEDAGVICQGFIQIILTLLMNIQLQS